VRFFDLIEEHDRIRPAPDRFGKLAAFLVADVSGGAPISGRGVFLHVLAHVDPIIAFSSSNKNSASARESSVLPTPVGPRKNERTERTIRVLQPARARRTALPPL